MKDSKIYAQKIMKLYGSLKKGPKIKTKTFDDPVDAIVYAIISENMESESAKSIYKKMEGHFVDQNDLRVSREEEIMDVFGGINEEANKTAILLRKALEAILEKYESVGLTKLKEMGKRQAKTELEAIKCLSPFVVNYCFLTSLAGHAIPLTEQMVDFLKDEELVHPESTSQQIEGFLERQISAANAYEFYTLLKQESKKICKKKVKAPKKINEKSAVKTKKKTKKK
jgi:endonuclease III